MFGRPQKPAGSGGEEDELNDDACTHMHHLMPGATSSIEGQLAMQLEACMEDDPQFGRALQEDMRAAGAGPAAAPPPLLQRLRETLKAPAGPRAAAAAEAAAPQMRAGWLQSVCRRAPAGRRERGDGGRGGAWGGGLDDGGQDDDEMYSDPQEHALKAALELWQAESARLGRRLRRGFPASLVVVARPPRRGRALGCTVPETWVRSGAEGSALAPPGDLWWRLPPMTG